MKRAKIDPFGTELKRFANDLNRRQFRALDAGFGFAEISKKHEPKATVPQSFAYTPPVRLRSPIHAQILSERPVINDQASPSPQAATKNFIAEPKPTLQIPQTPINPIFIPPPLAKQSRPKFGLFTKFLSRGAILPRIVIAHLIDLAVVTCATSMAIFIGALCFAPRQSEGLVATILAWLPVNLLMSLRLPYVVLLTYILYFIYRMFLVFAAGSTLGHSLAIKASRASE